MLDLQTSPTVNHPVRCTVSIILGLLGPFSAIGFIIWGILTYEYNEAHEKHGLFDFNFNIANLAGLFFATYSIFILSTVASLIVAPTPDGQKRSSMFIAFWIVNIVVFGLGNLFMLVLDLPELGLILCILSLIGGWILGLNALFREQKNTAGMATALWINAICLTGGPGGVIAIWLIFTDS